MSEVDLKKRVEELEEQLKQCNLKKEELLGKIVNKTFPENKPVTETQPQVTPQPQP